MNFTINGMRHVADVDTRTSLLDLLRDHLALTGTKKGCNQGACGACTVLVDGKRILSCMALAVQYQDQPVTTIEGIGSADSLSKIQQAFVDHDGFQCGYCTPGQICSAVGMLGEVSSGIPSIVSQHLADEAIDLTNEEIRERMSGNLCRCGAYNGIVDAIREMADEGAAS
jgi:xanthine dehydrogenase YagT iron-sulfur-binding subunit